MRPHASSLFTFSKSHVKKCCDIIVIPSQNFELALNASGPWFGSGKPRITKPNSVYCNVTFRPCLQNMYS